MSGKFDFRLEKVLTYREGQEKAAQCKLANAQYSLQNALQELSGLRNELTEVFRKQKEERGIDVSRRLLSARYAEYLTSCIANAGIAVQAKEAEVKERRKQLEGNMQDRKILSTLKEKKHEAFDKESNLEEQRKSDEFAITSFCRR